MKAYTEEAWADGNFLRKTLLFLLETELVERDRDRDGLESAVAAAAGDDMDRVRRFFGESLMESSELFRVLLLDAAVAAVWLDDRGLFTIRFLAMDEDGRWKLMIIASMEEPLERKPKYAHTRIRDLYFMRQVSRLCHQSTSGGGNI